MAKREIEQKGQGYFSYEPLILYAQPQPPM